MHFYTACFACCLFLLAACQQERKVRDIGRPYPPTITPIEGSALFFWTGLSSVQHFGHYEQNRQRLILDSTTRREYEVRIFDTCLDITAVDTMLAICNDADSGHPSVTRLLGRTQPLSFVYEGNYPKEQLRIYERAPSNQSVRQVDEPLRRVVVFELRRFPWEVE
jgi:hypothetical protein